MSGTCPDRNTRCGLRRFIRSFGIVQSASLQLILLHVALSSSLYRCRAGDVMRVPRNKDPWTWMRDGQSCSECHAPALPGHGEARKSAVSLLADDEALSDDRIAANASSMSIRRTSASSRHALSLRKKRLYSSCGLRRVSARDRKSTRLNSSH